MFKFLSIIQNVNKLTSLWEFVSNNCSFTVWCETMTWLFMVGLRIASIICSWVGSLL